MTEQTEQTPGDDDNKLVIHYLNEEHFHRSDPSDDMRPACEPERIRGTLIMHTTALRDGIEPCPKCWPTED